MIVPKKTKINNQTTIDCDFHGKTQDEQHC